MKTTWQRIAVVILSAAFIISIVPAALAAGGPTFTVTSASAYLRNGPGTSYDKLYSVFQGQTFPIVARSADYAWLRVTYTTEETWISAGTGTVSGDLDNVPVGAAPAPAASPTSTPAGPGAPAPASAPAVLGACDATTACFHVYLQPDQIIGDFYVDGVLLAASVNNALLPGAPDVPHLIEARNIQWPGAAGFGDLYVYPNQSMTLVTKANWTIRGWFFPEKQYLKGTLRYTCDAKNAVAGESLACRPTVDGVLQADVAPGATISLFLAGGGHAIHTDLVGTSAANYSAASRDDTVVVTAGMTNYFSATFTRKGQFVISTFPSGLAADFYLDGALVAAQSSSSTIYVGAGVNHKVEARNIVDPAAGGRYTYNDASSISAVSAGRIRYVTLRPAKVWLTGNLNVTCIINGKLLSDDIQCQVGVDGAPLGNLTANSNSSYSLSNGAHAVTITPVGASAGKWSGPVTSNVAISGGRTSYFTARLNLGANASTTNSTAPVYVAPGSAGSGIFELGGQVDSFSRPDLMRYAGMTWVKRQMRFSPGSHPDAGLIADAHAKGFKILISLLGSPDDIRGGANYDAYATYAGEVAAAGADAIEVWNETNLDREWPRGEIDPVKYTDLLRRAYAQIKSRNPNTLVISAAPAPTGAEGAFGLDRVWNDDRYIRGLAAAGAANYMDCLGIHYNEGIISPTLSSGDPRDNYYTRYYSGMVNTYLGAFGNRRKLCFTELAYITPEGYPPLPSFFGWAGNTTVAEQAQWLAEAVGLSRANSMVRMVIVFNVDFTNYGDDPMAASAIIRPGGGCPACDSLHAVMAGH